MKKPILALIALTLAGCAVKLQTPTQTDVDRVQDKYPGYTLEELHRGKAMFEQQCTVCHKMKDPKKHSEQQWELIVPEMVGKANKKNPNSIDAQTQELIQKYVITMSGSSK